MDILLFPMGRSHVPCACRALLNANSGSRGGSEPSKESNTTSTAGSGIPPLMKHSPSMTRAAARFLSQIVLAEHTHVIGTNEMQCGMFVCQVLSVFCMLAVSRIQCVHLRCLHCPNHSPQVKQNFRHRDSNPERGERRSLSACLGSNPRPPG